MTANYEKEQKELLELAADGKKRLLDAEQTKVDLRLLMKALRDYTDIRRNAGSSRARCRSSMR